MFLLSILISALTVVVTVDGLHTENLELLQPYWTKGGLRTITEEGSVTTYPFTQEVYGGNETLVAFLTGVGPDKNGYAMDYTFSRKDRKIHPTPLQYPTFVNHFRLAYGAKAGIYVVGIDSLTTNLLASNTADYTYIIDESYLPTDDERYWVPRMDVSIYNRPTAQEKKNGWKYRVRDYLPQTPVINSMVIEKALKIQKDKDLGKDAIPDLLLLQLHTRTPQSTSDRIETAEQEDLYLWLNQDLGYLMEQLNRRIGEQNYRILIIGLPRRGMNQARLEAAGIHTGTFNVDRAAALTNTYLMALYGHERWVDGGYGHGIYLNRKLIEQKRMDLYQLQRQVATFLMEFEGVADAYPAMREDVHFDLYQGYQLLYGEKKLDSVWESNCSAPLLYWPAGFTLTYSYR